MSKYAEIAKRNYPNPWNIAMLRVLVERGRITAEEFKEITGEPVEPEPQPEPEPEPET